MRLKEHKHACLSLALGIFIFTIQYQFASSYVLGVNQIRDLEKGGNQFIWDAASWTYSPLFNGVTKVYTICNSTYILGGYGIFNQTGITAPGNHFLQRVYASLPSHNRIFFAFQLWILDSWEPDDSMEIKFDSITFNGWNLLISSYSTLTNLCGETSQDLAPLKILGSIAHNTSSLTFKVVAKTNETTLYESFGIKDIALLFATNSTITGNTFCGTASITLPSQQCVCPDGQYKQGSNPCLACHSYCTSCYGPSAFECYQCKEGYSFNGTGCFPCYSACVTCNGPGQNQCKSCMENYLLFLGNTCVPLTSCTLPLSKSGYTCTTPCSLSQFLYWNGACSNTCDFPLKNNTLLLNTVKACQYPCSAGQILYWNGTCLTTCSFPLKTTTSNGKNFCNLPCNLNDFVYWNGTCSSICEQYLNQTIQENIVKVCQFPCKNSTEFLYYNGSCIVGCLSPFKSNAKGGKPYCNLPCNSNQYLYLNGTCSPAICQHPYQQTLLVGAVNACISVCVGATPYLYWNDTCMSACPTPLRPSLDYGIQACNFPCNDGDFLYWNGTCSTYCNFPLSLRFEGGVRFCDYPCSSATQYLFWNGTCDFTCPTPLKPRTEATKLYCDLPCNLTDFLYWNNTCLTSCKLPPLVHAVQHSVNLCQYPCLSTQYLHWNSICDNNCPYPLISRLESTKNFCDLPCDINDFLYWNGSCLKSCDFPLTNRVLYDVKLCEFPCASTSQYLYWNGTCLDSCGPFYASSFQGRRNFCNPKCLSTQALFLNTSTCMDNCPGGFFINNITKLCQECEISLCEYCPPNINRKCLECKPFAIQDVNDTCKKCESLKVEFIRTTKKYHLYRLRLMPYSCDLDLKTVQNNFKSTQETLIILPSHSYEIIKLNKNLYQLNLYLHSSLYENKEVEVELLYLRGFMKVPKTLIPDKSLENLASGSSAVQNTLAGMMGASFGGTLALGAAAALWSILSFQQFVGYFIYINVELPFQVKLFLSLFKSISWDILPNPLATLTSKWSKDILAKEDDLKQYFPPRKFADNDVTSFFIENAGSIIAVNMLLLLILSLVILLKKIPRFKNSKILKNIIIFLKWNVILRTFLENGIPLSLAIFLQIRTMSFAETYLKICIVCTAFSAAYLVSMIYFIMRILQTRDNTNLAKRVVRKHYGTLYEGMVLGRTKSKYYHLLILFRGLLIVFLVSFFEDYPLVQSTILIYFNIAFIYFLYTKAAFENRKLNIINRIKEILILVGEFCVLFLQFQTESRQYYDILGWVMVGALALALLIELLYTIIIQLLQVRTIFKKMYDLFKIAKNFFSKKPEKSNIKACVIKKDRMLAIANSRNESINFFTLQAEESNIKA